MKYWIVAILVGVTILAQGCSGMEPQHGTRVSLAFDIKKPVTRGQLVAISKYLNARGEYLLGVKYPRVDEVSDYSLVLLLPGKKIRKTELNKLIRPYSIELYHLTNVASDSNPNRPWKIKTPSSPSGSYILIGPKAARIDSRKEPRKLFNVVVKHSSEKPILTGRDILPNASYKRVKNGWAVLVRFKKVGAQAFFKFTKNHHGEYLAVFYDGRLVSAPIIREPIPGGAAFITGFSSESEARQAVSELNAGILPLKIKISKVEYY